MELRTLTYFLVVANEGNITKASNTLHISQPSLSRQIKNLEEELSCKLFIRKSHSVVLTEEGIHLKKRAEEILDLVERTEEEFTVDDSPLSGSVYIGSGETQAVGLIADVVRFFRNKHGNVTFHFFSGNADDIVERLEKGLIDFGIVIAPFDLENYNYLKLPTKDRWGALIPSDHPLSYKSSILRDELRPYPLILSSQTLGNYLDNPFLDWLGKDLHSFEVVATYNLIYNAMQLVKADVGIALTLDGLISSSEENQVCFLPLDPPLEAELYVIWKKDKLFSRAAESFLEQLKRKFDQKN